MRVFVLEDDPMRLNCFWEWFSGHELTCCTDAADAAHVFMGQSWDLASLDHDLGGEVYVSSDEDNTGAGFVRQCGEALARVPNVVVHSYNQAGAMRMIAGLADHGKDVPWTPFGSHAHKAALGV